MSKKVLKNEPDFRRSDLNEMMDRSKFTLLDLMGIIAGSNAEISITIKPNGFIQFNLKEECTDKNCYKTHYQDGTSVGYEEMTIKK